VAERAGVPLSQIHYHFGSKQKLMLALLAELDRTLLDRQRGTYSSDAPLWQQWEEACEHLEADLKSGYVRILQEMIAAGWSDAAIAAELRSQLERWLSLLTEVAERADQQLGGLGPFTARQVAALVGGAFLGAEQAILLGFDEETLPIRSALRTLGTAIRLAEEGH
jgi:AcrR family transcriptional regulator